MTETEFQLMAARAEREALRIQLDAEREAHKATKAGLVEAEKIETEVRAFIAKCQAEQGKAFCAFCGEVTPREALSQHIGACAAHPMRAVEQERDSLRAQLAALAAEHEESAKTVALHFERLAAFAADAADFSSEGVGGPLMQIEGMARAALVNVGVHP